MNFEDQASSTGQSDKVYKLPSWFLEQNVKTSRELTTIRDQVVFCNLNCKDCEETKLADDVFEDVEKPGDKPEGVPKKNETGQTVDEMHYKTCSELRDVICASFMPFRNTKLRQDSTTVFRMQEKDTSVIEPAWMSRVVQKAVKASKGISMISFDLEILEELGCEFYQQDKERADDGNLTTAGWEPNMESFTTFLGHFFATRSKAKANQKAWDRNQQVLSTILDAVNVKQTAGSPNTGIRGGPDAVLIHIMDCSLLAQDLPSRTKRRVLTRIADMVRARRLQGEAVAILLSTKCPRYKPGAKEFKKVGATGGSTVTASTDKILDWDQRKEVRKGIVNTQRMRRLMRHHLPPDLVCAEVLTVHSDWASANRAQTYKSFGEKLWSFGDVEKAITLLVGRGWRISEAKSQMSFTDICSALKFLGLFHQAEADPESQDAEETGEANPQDDDSGTKDESLQTAVEPSAWPLVVSLARQEWEHQKTNEGESNAALDSLMSLVGLEEVKSQFMTIKHLVDAASRQDADLAQEGLGAVFMGSPGSGKSTVAGLYAQFLSALGVIPHLKFKQITGARLADEGVDKCRSIIMRLEETNNGDDGKRSLCKVRGVLFVDEAHKLVPDGAGRTFNYLVDEIQRLQGQVIFLFGGPLKQMQSFVGLSPSLRSHVPFTFKFDDFTDGELHQILVQQLQSKFQGKMRVEGGANGVFMRILSRRIGRGRGSGCFANARDVQGTLLRVLLRQANRLSQAKRLQQDADDMFLTQTDLIGPPPMSILENSTAWKKLQDMTGLASVKQSVRALICRIETNYERELAEESLVETSLNKVFLGSPGTGKTTVAKYYGQILTELGLLSNGEVIVKSCQDFMGEYLGQSENLTKAILDSARGKVLIIDEAYGLARDYSYSQAVIDTIVAEVQATSTEDRAVLLLGYKEEMEEMFRAVNPGLARRFPLSSAFEFQDFSDEEMRCILDQKLQAQGFTASDEAKKVAMEVLGRSRNRPNFGNAGEIDILLDRAKTAQQIRLNGLDGDSSLLITELKEADFDADYDRQDRAESNIREAFANFVDAEALVAQFQAYQRVAQNSKDMGSILESRYLSTSSSVDHQLGQIFFDMGFLATREVEVCSASELIAEYVGQTGPKTQRLFQKALGKVLFIDEAYRLADENHWGVSYGKQAVDEIVNLVTLPKYKNRLVVVLAGYDRDINYLLATNPGFGSRFSEVVQFSDLSANHCQELFVRLLQGKKLGVGSLRSPSVAAKIQASFQTLSGLPGWGNARDVENLATSLFGKIISTPVSPPSLEVAAEWVYENMDNMIRERRKRAEDGHGAPNSESSSGT